MRSGSGVNALNIYRVFCRLHYLRVVYASDINRDVKAVAVAVKLRVVRYGEQAVHFSMKRAEILINSMLI
jgi:hypothetical protein